ncbi:MAG: protein kinase [Myxococcales bacterium]|nr:protein kinase [Myxococcales bacterium]
MSEDAASESTDGQIGELPTHHDASSESQVTCAGCGAQFPFGPNFCPTCGTPTMSAAVQDPLVGMVIADRYRIVSVLGRGGMGVVYRCEHTKMGKSMAIKLLHGDLARDRKVLERFRREAQAVSRLSSPYTVSIFDYGTSDGLTYLVMELVEGDDLGKLLRSRGTLSPMRLCRICAQACESLAEAHDKGIIHRDVKPENLLVTRGKDGRDTVKLLDFGLARLRDGEERNEITGSGALLGTPYYMAPEIIRGREADARSDVYAVGAMLYRGLVGSPPYTGSSPIAVLTKALTEELVPPAKRRPDLEIPPELDELVTACLAKEPEQRPQRVEQLKQALEAYMIGASGDMASAELTRPRSVIPGADKPATAATRDDVEAFERKIRRDRIAGGLLFVIAGVALLAALVVVLGRRRVEERRAHTAREIEFEPNNSATLATLIAPATNVRGSIGQRPDRSHGDVDFFRLSPRPPGRYRLRVELETQPNIDTVIEVFRSDIERAVFVAREARAGETEIVAGLTLGDTGEYFLSLHEEDGRASVPSENITDQYTLRYTLEPIGDDRESEPNDRDELASELSTREPRRGYIESQEDSDVWCPRALTAPIRVRLSPPAGMDLELAVIHRDGRAREEIDRARAGEAEVATLEPESPRPPCLVVRASQQHPLARGDGARPYTLEPATP